MRDKFKKLKWFLLVLVVGVGINAAIISNFVIPNTFNTGDTITAASMNQNFQAIGNAINELRDNRAQTLVRGKLTSGSSTNFVGSNNLYGGEISCQGTPPLGGNQEYLYGCEFSPSANWLCPLTRFGMYEDLWGDGITCTYDDMINGNLLSGDSRCFSKSDCDEWNDWGGGNYECKVNNDPLSSPYSKQNINQNLSNCTGAGPVVCEITSNSVTKFGDGSSVCEYSDINNGVLAAGGVECFDGSSCDSFNGIDINNPSTSEVLKKGANINVANLSWDISLNRNNSFNPTTGEFTAPVTGTYDFKFSIALEGTYTGSDGNWDYINYPSYRVLVNNNEVAAYDGITYVKVGSNYITSWGGSSGLGNQLREFINNQSTDSPTKKSINLNAGDILKFDVKCGPTFSPIVPSWSAADYSFDDCTVGGEISERNSALIITLN